MILTLYLDMPKDEPDPGLANFATAFARPAFAAADDWERWRIDLDLVSDQAACEARIRRATLEERAAFTPWNPR